MLSKKSKSGSARFFCLGDNHPKSHTELATTRCQRAPLPSLYGPKIFRASPEKDFFDSIDPKLPFAIAAT
jgi:hypothetical protein